MQNVSREPLIASQSINQSIASESLIANHQHVNNQPIDQSINQSNNRRTKACIAIVLIIAWLVIPAILTTVQDGPGSPLMDCSRHDNRYKYCPSGTGGSGNMHCCESGYFEMTIQCSSTQCWKPVFGTFSLYLYFGWTSPFFIILSIIICCRIMRRGREHVPSTYLPLPEIAMIAAVNQHDPDQAV